MALAGGLVGYWSLDASVTNFGANTTSDLTSSANTGTLANMTSGNQVSGKIKEALSFNDSNTSVTVPHATPIDLTSAASVAAWIFPNNWTNTNASVQKKNLNYIFRNESGVFRFYWWTTGGNIRYVQATLPTTGSWHHVIGMASGDDASAIYVDGSLASGAAVTLSAGTRNVTQSLIIGAGAGAVDAFNGNIDEFAIWNRALSASEVTQLYNGGNGLPFSQLGFAFSMLGMGINVA